MERSAIRKFALGGVTLLGGTFGGMAVTLSRAEETIRPHTRVALVDLGGLTLAQAEAKLRAWWEIEKTKPISLVVPGLKTPLPEMLPEELGVTFDPKQSLINLPRQNFTGEIRSTMDPSAFPVEDHNPIYSANGIKPKALNEKVVKQFGPASPARVDWDNGAIMRKQEGTLQRLDETKIVPAVITALESKKPAQLALIPAVKRVPDAELDKVKEVVTAFTTRFAARNVSRCNNIRLAAHLIDGRILMPGEQFSFNGTVGRRTKKAGFQEAGVYINGKHDTGVGGGICQVSTTLYNAALLANLPIKRRSNHSLPVPYVPLGQDATVDYGNLDLVFVNNYAAPLAIDAEYHPGRLTFRLLGQRQPGLVVKVVQGERKTVPIVVQRRIDPNAKPGSNKIIEPGSSLRSIKTYRLVYLNGKLVKRQPLGRSLYGGMPRVVVTGPSGNAGVQSPPTAVASARALPRT